MKAPGETPFIRWADAVQVEAGKSAAFERQLYDHELVYVLEGQGSIILDGQKHAARPDSLFLVRPRVWHSFLADQNEAQWLLGVHFDWDWHDAARFDRFFAANPPCDESLFRAPREISGWDLAARPYLDLAGRPRVRRMLEEVATEYGRGDSESRRIAGAMFLAALGQIEREVRLLGEISSQESIGADAVRRVQKARDLLEAPRERPISVDEVAERVGWSADHLRRMTKAVLDTSPAQLQNAARMRRAKELLRYGTLPIADIARRCGFDDASHFARVFRREIGQTPREWAALSRGASEK